MAIVGVIDKVALIPGSIINQLKEMTEKVKLNPQLKLALNKQAIEALQQEEGWEELYAETPESWLDRGISGTFNEVQINTDKHRSQGLKTYSVEEEEPTAWLQNRAWTFEKNPEEGASPSEA